MPFSAQLGTINSQLANIELGSLAGVAAPPAPTPTPVLKKALTLVPRVPKNEILTDRMVRFTEQVGNTLNGLILAEVLVPGGGGTLPQLAGLFFPGSGPPDPTLGFNGDSYFDVQTATLWEKLSGLWRPIYRFPQSSSGGGAGVGGGAQRGEQGMVWFSGFGPPSTVQGRTGDFYLQDNGDVWKKIAPIPFAPPSWVKFTSIKGSKGDAGHDGQPGRPGAPGTGGGGASTSTPGISESLIAGHVAMRV